ncbi:tagatose-6-phosphate kinase [Fragilaria crotonensis]|nr:tagatose-6-phosphate kinase [Fragilaria crotonensis]
MSSGSIIVGLNGALQKRFVLQPQTQLIPGNVHRASTIQTGVGGKGQDVAISMACLECTDGLQLAQFVGSGPEGDLVQSLLQTIIGDTAATSLSVRTASAMRTCTTIVGSEESTELVEPSGIVTEEEQQLLLEKLSTTVSDPSAICIMGSMPPGLPADMYATIYEAVASDNTLCVMDSVTGLEQMMKALSGRALLKINASELCQLAGIKKSTSEAGGIVLEELIQAIKAFIIKFNALNALEGLAITDGKHPSFLVAFGEAKFDVYKIQTPALNPNLVLYPIGAGDSVTAGTLASWTSLASKKQLSQEIHDALEGRMQTTAFIASERTRRIEAAFAFGLACGSASCLKEENSVFAVDDVLKLYQEMAHPELVATDS